MLAGNHESISGASRTAIRDALVLRDGQGNSARSPCSPGRLDASPPETLLQYMEGAACLAAYHGVGPGEG